MDVLFENFNMLVDAPNGIQKFREIVLQFAVQGKLVLQDPNDEPASVLLEKIKKEKEQLVAVGEIKKQETLPSIEDHEKSFNLPFGWEWCRMGDILTVLRGASPRPKGDPRFFSEVRTKYHWIKISDIRRHGKNGILYDTDEFLTEEGKNKSVELPKGTLILTNSATIAVPIVLGIDGGCIHDGYLAFPFFPANYISQKYILYLVPERKHLKFSESPKIAGVLLHRQMNNIIIFAD